MTAEVAILNKSAVALAADSAVTVGYPGKEKIFTGANKIFTLSKYAPVGIMIYGHSEHFGVPWETVIKQYRRRLGDKRFPTLRGYAADFIYYISGDAFMIDGQQNLYVLYSTISAIMTAKRELWLKSLKPSVKNLKLVLGEMDELTQNFDIVEGMNGITFKEFNRKYSSEMNSVLSDTDSLNFEMPKGVWPQIRQCVYMSTVVNMPSNLSSGIVIAGFGEDEFFPKLIEYRVDGGIFNRLRIFPGREDMSIERGGLESVYVAAFAQEEAVNAFMNGVDESYEKQVFGLLSGFLSEQIEDILRGHTSYSEEEIRTIISMAKDENRKAISDFHSNLEQFSLIRFSDPIKENLRSAPKDELGAVAESLVSLTSLKRRVSGDPETVSGPIDVAVISKGDGFVWIKRKHYFEKDLNPQFHANYLLS